MRSQRFLLALLLITFAVSLLGAQTSFTYSYTPKQVYATQLFSVTILADSDDSKTQPEFVFDKNSKIRPIDSTPIKDTNGGNTFYTFLFKAPYHDIKIPAMTILYADEITLLPKRYITVQSLDSSTHQDFCGIIATDCKIVSSQVSTFDDKSNLISMTIKATEANVEDINISTSIESGIEKITRGGSSVVIEYYFVVPSTQDSIAVSYYNSISHKFISKKISTNYNNTPVAAQDSLNPIDSSFDKIKRYGLIVLSLFFLFIFVRKRDFFYLPLLALSTIALLVNFAPHEQICIKQGSMLYIIPTEISSTGGQIREKLEVTLLKKRGKYNKIEYEKGKIGWIKDEDVCND